MTRRTDLIKDTTIVGRCRKKGNSNMVVISIGGWMAEEEITEAQYDLAPDKVPVDYRDLPWCSDASGGA